jgi:hypothetical protein
MDIQKVDAVAKKSKVTDEIVYNYIKSKYPQSNSQNVNVDSGGEKNQVSQNFSEILNDHERKTKLFQALPRKQSRRLSREQRLTKKIRDLSREESRKKAIKKLNNEVNSRIILPWVDSSLWSQFSHLRSNPLPSSKPSISRSEVQANDKECCSDYLSPERRIRNCWFSCFTVSACHAANDIGLNSFRKRNKCNVLSIKEAVENTAKSTHSGTPLMTKKSNPENISWTKRTMRDLFQKPTKGKMFNTFTTGLTVSEKGLTQSLFELPQMLFRRFQIGFNDNGTLKIKPRVVWCMPHLVVSIEAYFIWNLLQDIISRSKSDPEYPYNIGQTNRQISKSIESLRKNCIKSESNSIYSLDYSKYDRTIPIWFFDIFFSIVEDRLELSAHEKIIFDNLRMYIKYTPMIFEDKLTFKTRGISSGLFITNLLDTLFNLTLIKLTEIFFSEFPEYFDKVRFTKRMLFNERIDSKTVTNVLSSFSYTTRVLGDDGIVYWNKDKLQFLERLCFFLGMKLSVKNITKDPFNGTIFYLGRYWDENNIPDQTELYMAGHIILRTKWYNKEKLGFDIKDLDAMRILSICLPLKSGKLFIEKYLSDYEPLQSFLRNKKDFVLLKDWPHDEYTRFKFDDIPSDVLDF